MKKKSLRVYVIVLLDEDTNDKKATQVKMSSFRDLTTAAPRSFEEAAIIQHSDMEKAMMDLAEMFAQCGIRDNREALRLFNDELSLARNYQASLGGKARYRNVVFTTPETQMSD